MVFDTGVETEAYTAWVATDNYGAGTMGARRVGHLLTGSGKAGMIAVQPCWSGMTSEGPRCNDFSIPNLKQYLG